MNIIISNSSSIPIYEQIKTAIKQAIFSNELKEEDMLPSVRSMANDLKISFLTVKRAYDELEEEGYIKTVQGKGSFVAPKNLELIKEEKLREIQELIERIYDISKISNITEDEIKEEAINYVNSMKASGKKLSKADVFVICASQCLSKLVFDNCNTDKKSECLTRVYQNVIATCEM